MRTYAYVALAVVLIGGAKFAYDAIYSAGYNAAVANQSDEIDAARQAAVDEARAEWEATAEIAEAEIVIEERIVEVIREVEKEIPVVVERIVERTPECSDLGVDFAGLLNNQVRAGASGSSGGADTPTEPD